MRRWLLPVLAAVLVLGAAGAFAYSRLAEPPPEQGPDRPAAADTVAVERTDLVTSVTISGTLGFGATTTLTGRRAGTLTWLPPIGTVVDQGEKLYEVDAQPVPLLFGDTPLYRKLEPGIPPGPDVAELITNLRALGYRNPGNKNEFTEGTQAALKRWQKNVGLAETGVLDVGDAVVLPGKVRIDAVTAQPGAPANAELFAYTSVERAVSATLDPTQIDVAVVKPGSKVTLTLPGGTETTGTVGALTTQESSSEGGEPGQAATITVDDQNAVASVDSGPVQVTVVTGNRPGVLAVPVTALLALGEGGYALQVVSGRTTKLVGVETGMFAGDLVEVTGEGLTEGMHVVRAS
ncbi:peptidoglycan-binding protein [Actinophytocola sp.]|uniref:peptidoglycan-binding protein n=1 Tax=Actinophytocola sp. TaxID=1872138 RepID=UPI002ED4444F